MTLEQFSTIVHTACKYCGLSPEPRGKHQYAMNGVDRVDNSKDYIESNVVSCCKLCNHMKSNHNLENFLKHIKSIINHLGGI